MLIIMKQHRDQAGKAHQDSSLSTVPRFKISSGRPFFLTRTSYALELEVAIRIQI